MRVYKDLLKHSSIYGVGQILSRLASILLLPVYTHFLRPADYGVIAILDLVAGLLGIVIGSGMASAVNRFHFETDDRQEQSRIWSTGLVFLAVTSTCFVLPCWLIRDWLSSVTLGSEYASGGRFITLSLATVWLACVGQLPETYLRVRKWSGLSVVLSLVRLLLNIGLNVTLLWAFGLGIEGVLIGNLITGLILTFVLCGIQMKHERPITVDRVVLRKLLAFGAPLIATAVLSMVMHQADRYLLRVYLDLDQVGVYSLAYQIGQGVNTLCLMPFAAIWGTVIYEIAKQPDHRKVYARVFEYFVYGLAVVMLAASLFAEPLLSLLTSDDYAEAVPLIPVICLAYLFFSLHEHFRVPVLLARKTQNMVPVYLLAAFVNVGTNLVLVPAFHAVGAAWASVLTFAVFSGGGLLRYRKIERYPYPLRRCAMVMTGMGLTYAICRQIQQQRPDLLTTLVVSTLACLAWAGFLFGSLVLAWWRKRLSDEQQVNPTTGDSEQFRQTKKVVV